MINRKSKVGHYLKAGGADLSKELINDTKAIETTPPKLLVLESIYIAKLKLSSNNREKFRNVIKIAFSFSFLCHTELEYLN